VLFDGKTYKAAFGALYRQIDVVGRAYRAGRSPEALALRKKLQEFDQAFNEWYKGLAKAGVPR
jgi:hypothetical protein